MDSRVRDSEKSKQALIAEIAQACDLLCEAENPARLDEQFLTTVRDTITKLTRKLKRLEAFSALYPLYKEPTVALREILRVAVNVLVQALDCPQHICVRISVWDEECVSAHFIETHRRKAVDIRHEAVLIGLIEVFHLEPAAGSVDSAAEAREKYVLEELAGHLEKILSLRNAQPSAPGREQSAAYELAVKKDILANIEGIILPLIQRMRAQQADIPHLDILEKSLRDIAASFGRKLIGPLTARETEICHMVRSGLSGKDIAEVLGISFGTVEVHRNNIRKKLDLVNQNISLAAYLKSL